MNEKLEQHLSLFAKDADEWFASHPFVSEYYYFFQDFFKKENLEQLTWEDIQEMGNHLHAANSLGIAKKRAFGKPNHDISHYVMVFKYIKYSPDSLSHKIEKIINKDKKYKILGFGPSIWSELLAYIFPDQLIFQNTRSAKALSFLGFDVANMDNGNSLSNLLSFGKSIQPISDSYLNIVKKKTQLPLNFEIDQFFSYIREKYADTEDEVIDELNHYYAYHLAFERGPLKLEIDTEISFSSEKSKNFLQGSIGNFVWIIESEKSESKKAIYYLSGIYIPDTVRKSGEDNRISGEVFHVFNPKIQLNEFEWFSELFINKQMASFGFNKLHGQLRSHFIRFASNPFFFDEEDYLAAIKNLSSQHLKFLNTLAAQPNQSADSKTMAKLMGYADQVVANNTIGKIGKAIVKASGTSPEILFEDKILSPYEVVGLWINEAWKMNSNLFKALQLISKMKKNNEDIMTASVSKNTILYGPPGTGKTFNTIRKSLEICGVDKNIIENEAAAKKKFDELCDSRQVRFVTFHQSFGYEDFVECLRPHVNEAGAVVFKHKDSVFKEICSDAKEEVSKPVVEFDFNPDLTNVWKISLGNTQDADDDIIYESCMRDDFITLNYGLGLDFTKCSDRESVKALLAKADPSIKNTDFNISSVNMFKNDIKKNDLIIVTKGNFKFRAIGRVVGDYVFNQNSEYQQTRKVEWLLKLENGLSHESIMRKQFSQMTIYWINKKDIKTEVLKDLLSNKKVNFEQRKNFVLIIDEINRGNISKIFGELITLIEEDKRIGSKNAIRAQLPYSNEMFGVPSNVFILGTMNTADRSIALIDLALRRRFDFIEMIPNANVIRSAINGTGVTEGVDLVKIFNKINDRIEYLCDRDHMLGHAFFLDATSLDKLREVFLKKVIPLLQEYFTEDWSKIGMVLGCDFSSGKGNQENNMICREKLNFKNLFNQDEENEEKYKYYINPNFLSTTSHDLKLFFDDITN
ncbi:MAG: AAA family ATPase [Bdellovibrionaceae bacterium]|nr:AAA family ATPase [Pseudobdellovibrionaceae bacterium]